MNKPQLKTPSGTNAVSDLRRANAAEGQLNNTLYKAVSFCAALTMIFACSAPEHEPISSHKSEKQPVSTTVYQPQASIKAVEIYPTFLHHLANEEEQRRRQLPGARIGMSERQALSTAWGDPGEIKPVKTKAATGDRWIYPEGNILYFEGGAIVRIKTPLS